MVMSMGYIFFLGTDHGKINLYFPEMHDPSMEIIRVKWMPLHIPLKKPFKIALGTTTNYSGYILKICTARVCGYGEAVPSPKITGDTMESIEKAFRIFKPLLLGEEAHKIGWIMNKIYRAIPNNTAAKAAVDMALYDLVGSYWRVRVSDILGGEKEKVDTSVTIGITSIEDAVKQAIELTNLGARVLKVKIGLNPDEDIKRIKEIRNVTDARIRIDANQGYSLNQAIRVLKSIEKYNIEFAEQPLPKDRIDDLKTLRESVGVPIIADESVHNAKDVLKLIGKVDGINIKLMKSGGIYEALKMASIAKAAEMKIMVGCMVETKLGIAAGQNFALGIGADYADLDGYMDITRQPFIGLEFKDGGNIVEGERGLGVECRNISIC